MTMAWRTVKTELSARRTKADAKRVRLSLAQTVIRVRSADAVSALVHRIQLALQLIVADGSHHHFLADDEARRAVDLERVRHSHLLAQTRLDLVALHLLAQFVHIETEVTRHR